MVEGSSKWKFPLVSQSIDEWGRPRGSLNLAVACLALPGDPIRLLAAAYMGPSGAGYSILYWSLSTDIAVLTSSSLSIRDNHISHRNGFWYLESATLHSRASGLVVCICGENPCTWDINRWLRWINSRTYGGIVYASGWTSWGDLLRPLSLSEKKRHHAGKYIFPTWAIILENGFLDIIPGVGPRSVLGSHRHSESLPYYRYSHQACNSGALG